MNIDGLLLSSISFLPLMGVIVLLIWKSVSKTIAATVAIVIESACLIIAFYLIGSLINNQSVVFTFPWISNLNINFSLKLDWLTLIFLIMEVMVTLVAMVYSLGDKDGEENSNQYYSLLLLFSLGMSGTTLAEDIFLFYVYWELMLVASVLLILIWGHGENRAQVALKYFIFTHLGSLLVLIGLISLYVNSGTASLSTLALQVNILPVQQIWFLTLLFLLGFCVKMAIFPLHIWLPDAHTVAPMPVTIILAAAMLAMGTYGIIRFPFSLFGLENMRPFAIGLMIAGNISEIYGAFMSFAEKDIKRIIAYSSVSQMGYILFGLGTLSQQGIMGGIMHVVYHAIVKALLFMVVGILINVTGERQIDQISGLGGRIKIVTACAVVGLLSISGMPPLGIFNSEWMIFAGGFESGFPVWITLSTLLGSIFTLVYALRFFGIIFLGELKPKTISLSVPLFLLIPTVLVSMFLIVEGFFPESLLNWTLNSFSSVFGGGQ
jgi:NADH-quinone oxidoreductase subunit M